MIRTKQDIQLELLQELDNICSQNNLHYILWGDNALNAYKYHTIKNGARIVSVAMTQGDAERFFRIVQENNNNNRYVEGLINNQRTNALYLSYGNKATADFSAVNLKYNKYRGIRIRIYYIKKGAGLDDVLVPEWTPQLMRERKIRKLLNTRIVNKNLKWIDTGLSILRKIYFCIGGIKYYERLRNRTFIDRWEDIQNYKLVRIGQSGTVDANLLKHISQYEVDGNLFCMPEQADAFFSNYYTEDFRKIEIHTKTQRLKTIVNTDNSYEQIKEQNYALLLEIRSLQEQILWKRFKARKEKECVMNVWRLVQMTNRQVKFKQYFVEKQEELMQLDLNQNEQFERLCEELNPVISSMKKYAHYGMTFSINPEIDKLIDAVLVKGHQQKLLFKLERLRKQKYFIK